MKCHYSSVAQDQSYVIKDDHRTKRFVLFPEFELWFNDWRYLNHPKEFFYWISNYYPQYIETNSVRLYIHRIIENINSVIDHQISVVSEAKSADQSNFNYNFFNYEICPKDDRNAIIKGVENTEIMLIYSADVVKENRYRAHGGISINYHDNSTISNMKFNIHHQFIFFQDFEYDPVIYTCNSDESKCIIDLYAVMLHETLHGFGIEHTERNLTTKNVLAVMRLFASRIMCHDDIRAIRKVYGLAVKRENIRYDQVCRRDFPMNYLQKLLWRMNRWIHYYAFRLGLLISLGIFLMTIIYISLRKYCGKRNNSLRYSIQSDTSEQSGQKIYKHGKNAFLWHDELN